MQKATRAEKGCRSTEKVKITRVRATAGLALAFFGLGL